MKAPSVSGLLQVIAVLPAAGFVLGLFGRFHWTLDLFSHFRAQYAAALLGCAIGFFVLRQRKSALVSLVAGLLISTTILLSSQSLPPAGKAIPLKVISFNVNTANTRQEEILRFLQAENADVLFLMEVNDAWMTALRPLDAAYPYRLAAPGRTTSASHFIARFPSAERLRNPVSTESHGPMPSSRLPASA